MTCKLICVSTFAAFLLMLTGCGGYDFSHIKTYPVDGNAEIIAWHPAQALLVATNSRNRQIDMFRFDVETCSVTPLRSVAVPGEPTSVALTVDGRKALATVSTGTETAGDVWVFSPQTGEIIRQVLVGIQPDSLCLGRLGKQAIIANEAEENDRTPGSIGIMTIHDSDEAFSIDYQPLDGLGELLGLPEGIIEPEYCAISDHDEIAVVSCQENDSLVLLDLRGNRAGYAGVIRLEPADEPDGVAVIDWYDAVLQKQGWLVAAACEGRKQNDRRGGQCVAFYFVWDRAGLLQVTPLPRIDFLPLFDAARIDPEGIEMIRWQNHAAVFVSCERTDALVCILLDSQRRRRFLKVVDVGTRPEGVRAAVIEDSVFVFTANEGRDGENGSISLCRLQK